MSSRMLPLRSLRRAALSRVWLAFVAVLVVCGVLGLTAGAAWAEEVRPRTAPASYFMGQLKHSVQTLNNCGPSSVVAAMSWYGVNVSQEEARRVLRPYSENRGMSHTVIAPYVAQFGLEAKARVNGNPDIIKSLVANNIPVIVLQWISESRRIGHFRVVQGYDDRQGVFYVDDSLLGPNVAIPYDSFEQRWNYQWTRYIPVYRPDQAPLVAAILGDDWTDKGMYERAIPELREAIHENLDDWTAWGRLVEAYTGAEQYQAALDALDGYTARRGFGYSFMGNNSATRIKLLNKLGRYDEALDAAQKALDRSYSGSYGNGSLQLQLAEALRGLGRTDEARAAYQAAIRADGTMSEAAERLATLQ
ncbi:MAG: C39 family peptidase [Anaerolineae bacterium]